MSKIKLGQKVKDLVTGFSGISIGRAEYLYGDPEIQIQPVILKEDGQPVNSKWFVENRIELTQGSTPVGLRSTNLTSDDEDELVENGR